MAAAFLYLETPSTHMQVTGVLVLDPGSLDGREPFAEVRRLLDERLHLLPSFRRRLVEVPLRAAHPVWIEDPDFELDAHLHRWALPAPGSRAELEALTGDLAGRRLDGCDRSRPPGRRSPVRSPLAGRWPSPARRWPTSRRSEVRPGPPSTTCCWPPPPRLCGPTWRRGRACRRG